LRRTESAQRSALSRALLAAAALTLPAGCARQQVVDHPSANFDGRIRFLVIHFTDEDFQRSLDILTKPSSYPVSAHYLVGRSGEAGYDHPVVFRLVDEAQRAWHAGPSRWQRRENLNDTSIGIEIVYESQCPRDADVAARQPWETDKTCAYPDFPPDQIAVVIDLARGILQRHPDIDPSRVVGHSDIQPEIKTDPGPRFPWRQLAQAGVGAWPDADQVERLRAFFAAQPASLAVVQEALRAWGYGVPSSGVEDERTREVLSAFHSHFEPELRSDQADTGAVAILFALLSKYRPQELEKLRAKYPELPGG